MKLSERDARVILDKAARTSDEGVNLSDLLSAAKESGIDPDRVQKEAELAESRRNSAKLYFVSCLLGLSLLALIGLDMYARGVVTHLLNQPDTALNTVGWITIFSTIGFNVISIYGWYHLFRFAETLVKKENK